MERALKNIMVTGGAGFIGTNLIRFLFTETGFTGRVVNVDKLTYAGNPENLADIRTKFGGERYFFEKADICDRPAMDSILARYQVDTVVHLAAESHVDRSITGPADFINTNIGGTFALLEAVRRHWGERRDVLFHQVSTDEVFGSLGPEGYFHEQTPYAPRSPYSSSKAAADHLVRAYFHTYRLPVTLSNCSNNFGPYQFPEKMIPLMISHMLAGAGLPVYGDGRHVRDWLYVKDHAAALWAVITQGAPGESYNVGGENEIENIDLVQLLCETTAAAEGKPKDHYKHLITFVKDRPGHDRRYAINCDKIKRELGWRRTVSFAAGLAETVRWYLGNREWIESIRSGAYREWEKINYTNR